MATTKLSHQCRFIRVIHTGKCLVQVGGKEVEVGEGKRNAEAIVLKGFFRVFGCIDPSCEWTQCQILDIESKNNFKEMKNESYIAA